MIDIPSLQIGDYIVFSGMLLVSLLIGVYTSFKGSNSAEDYLLGSRSFGWWSVATSLLTTFISSISLLGYSGETYAHGVQLWAMLIGASASFVLNYYTCSSVFHSLKLTSVTEYVSLRFRSQKLRNFVTFLTLVKNIMYLGVCLYAPTIAITSVTSLETHTCIYVLGIICTVYSTIGGMRAVIWTDVFQMVIMFVGMLVVLVLEVNEVGGISEVWSTASLGGRTHIFDFELSMFVRHTFISIILFGFFFWGSTFGVDQAAVQRVCSVGNEKDLSKVFWLNLIGMTVMYTCVFMVGVASYAVYHGCDPTALGLITKKEEIVPFFVMHKASFIWGLPGLFIASLFSATLSSLSSSINGIVAVIWTDMLKDRAFLKNRSNFVTGLANKFLSLLTGATLICVSILCSYVDGVVQFCLTVMSVVLGPLYGMFLLGMLVPKATARGAFIGLFTSWVFITYIAIGSYAYRPPPARLEVSVALCNETLVEQLLPQYSNGTNLLPEQPSEDHIWGIYKLSYVLYPVVSTILSFVIGALVTYATEWNKPIDVSPSLLAPFIRRIYWKTPVELEEIPAGRKERNCTEAFI